MRAWPITCSSVLGVCAPLFARPVWPHVQVLLTGAVLAPGKRTVPAMLQVRGRRAASDLLTSHRVLHRAVWAPRTARRRRRLWVAGCIPRGGVVWGLDDTIERRRGEAMTAQGSSRAPGRSSHAPWVNVRGLRWLACRGLRPLAGADRLWALPVLTVWGLSERFSAQRGRRPHPWPARAWQLRQRVVRWLPGREGVAVADSRFAARALRDKVTPRPRARVRTQLLPLPHPHVRRVRKAVPGSQGSGGRRGRRWGQRRGPHGPHGSWSRGLGKAPARAPSPPTAPCGRTQGHHRA
jgi:hypothetical protein